MPANFFPDTVYRCALAHNLLAVLAPCVHRLGLPVYDSRKCERGSVYVAITGLRHDGHDFVDDAVDRGARLVVVRKIPERMRPGVGYWQVADTPRALSSLVAVAYRHPSRRLKVIGVTGTDGKTSVCYFIYQLLGRSGMKTALLSTFAIDVGCGLRANPLHQTTPGAPHVHAFLAEALAQGCEFAVLESSSHGLSPKTSRLADVQFSAGVFTNLSLEHLEFHTTMEQYAQDKSQLFRQLRGTAVINGADEYAPLMRAACGTNLCWSYGRAEGSDLRLLHCSGGMEGSEGVLGLWGRKDEIHLPIPGSFYLDNAALALLACHSVSDRRWEDWLSMAKGLEPPTGRMQRVVAGQDFYALIDYAHSPGAFARLLPELRRYTPGKLTVVFGSGGERDRAKRPLQGELADRYADVIILTDEDPRDEDSMEILNEIATGITGKREGRDLLLIPDRYSAISRACAASSKGDTVALLGKGHENSILVKGLETTWNEEQALRRILSTRPYT